MTELTKIRTINTHRDVWTIAFSPDGQSLAVGGKSRKVRIYDFPGGKLKMTLNNRCRDLDDGTTYLRYLSDGKTLVLQNDRIRIFHLSTKRQIQKFIENDEENTYQLSPDEKLLARIGANLRLTIYNISSGELLFLFREHQVFGAVFTPDSRGIIVFLRREIFLMDTSNFNQRRPMIELHQALEPFMERNHMGMVECLFSHNGQLLAIDPGREVIIYHLESNTILKRFINFPDWVMSMSFSPDDQKFVMGIECLPIQIWNLYSGSQVEELTDETSYVLDNTNDIVKFSPDGKWLVSNDKDKIHIWRVGAPGKLTKSAAKS